MFAIAVVACVGNDDVVGELDVHGLTGRLYGAREAVVLATGAEIAAGMVVAEDEGGGPLEQGLAHDLAHIDGGACNASATDEGRGDDAVVLAQEEHAALLERKVAHVGKVFVGLTAVGDAAARHHFLATPTAAQFAGCEQGDGLGLADALVATGEVIDGEASQGIETVVAVVQDALHESDSCLLGIAAADEYGQQFGIGEGCGPVGHHLLTRACVEGEGFYC